jgi:hypothetical protein
VNACRGSAPVGRPTKRSPKVFAGLEARDRGTAAIAGIIVELLGGTIVKRFFSTAVLGLAATALSVTPAMAAPPEPIEITAETGGCDFPVLNEVTGKTKAIEHAGDTKFISPNQRVTLTNTDTGESVSYVITGVARFTETDTGLTIRFTGHNLLFGPGIEGILYTSGTQTVVVDEEGVNTLTESHGKVVNICQVLAP